MRADRLLRLVLLLQTRGRMTAERLASELEVSTRTIYRDLQALSGAGFPIYAERGTGGGCQLVDGYRTSLTGLSAPEAEALAFAALPGAAAALGLQALAAAAHLKVLTAVSPAARDTITTVQRCFYLDPRGWFRTGERTHPQLPELARAVWDGRQIRAGYRRAESRSTSRPRVLGPLGLVLKDGMWYLVASEAAAGGQALKTYRVSRLDALSILDEPVSRPPDFDLAGWWDEWSDAFEQGLTRYEVTVRLSPAGVERIWELGDAVRRAPKQPAGRTGRASGGWHRRTLIFERPEWAAASLLRLGADVEVLDPPELRLRLAQTATALHALYGGQLPGARRRV